MARIAAIILGLLLAVPAGAQSSRAPLAAPAAEPVHPAPHSSPWPSLGSGTTPPQVQASLMLGPELRRGQSAREMLAERRALDRALTTLKAQRAGTVDAYVVAVALDSDPVFAREAREAANVLSRRYDAAGRTLVLAGPDGRTGGLVKGSIGSLTVALAHIAELIDPAEDVLVLYSTSHGVPQGLTYHEGDSGYGLLSPSRLGVILGELGFRRRILLLSACYSGAFVPLLAGPDTVMATAASADRPSFGCRAENDWTFFGDALINRALRKPQPLGTAVAEAHGLLGQWESGHGLPSSQPQFVAGAASSQWLEALEARMPRLASAPTGTPAVASLVPPGAALAGAGSR